MTPLSPTGAQATLANAQGSPDFRAVFECLPGHYMVLNPELRIVAASGTYVQAIQMSREEIVGRPLPEIFSGAPNDSSLANAVRKSTESFHRVLRNRASDAITVVVNDVRPEERDRSGGRSWNVLNSPVLAADGSVGWIIHRAEQGMGSVRCEKETEKVHALADELDQSERWGRERAGELAALLDAIPAPVFIAHDPECVTITGNRAAEELLRLPRGAEASLTAPSHTRPRHFRVFKDGSEMRGEDLPAQRAARGEVVRDFEETVVFEDGSSHEMIAYASPLRDDSGTPRGSILVLVDITALKKAENALRTSGRTLRKLSRVVEQSPTSVVITDLTGEIDYVNRKFTEVTGYALEEVLGKNPRLLKSGLQAASLYREMWETITAGREWRGELCNRKKDGELFWEYAVIAPVQDEQGDVTHFVAIKEDITERKRVEEALAESRHRLAGIVGSAMDAIISVDAKQRIVLFNSAAEVMFRCPANEAMGCLIGRFIPDRFRTAHQDHIRRFGESEVTSRPMGPMGAISGLRADGEEFPIEASISQVQVGGDKLCTVVLRDITRRKRLEHEVLAVSAREQERIGQDLHDDLCQCLAGTEYLASALAKDLASVSPADAARAQKIADVMRQANARARTLAHGLAPAVMEAAGITGALRELARNAEEMFRIHCLYEGPETLKVWDSTAALHLYRIAQEAVGNAVRHGRANQVHIILEAKAGSVTMIVRDDGEGIPQPLSEPTDMGVRTMRYRAGMLGGMLEIRPGASGGTEVICTFPLQP
jgi:two-component system sensor kinase FixL